jgi:hypothetical protein
LCLITTLTTSHFATWHNNGHDGMTFHIFCSILISILFFSLNYDLSKLRSRILFFISRILSFLHVWIVKRQNKFVYALHTFLSEIFFTFISHPSLVFRYFFLKSFSLLHYLVHYPWCISWKYISFFLCSWILGKKTYSHEFMIGFDVTRIVWWNFNGNVVIWREASINKKRRIEKKNFLDRKIFEGEISWVGLKMFILDAFNELNELLLL